MVIIRTPADVKGSNAAKLAKKYTTGGHLTVGIHKKDNQKYSDKDVTTAEVGFWQEFGHLARGGRSFILPKMWIRIFSLDEEHRKNLAAYASACFRDCKTAKEALQEIGKFMSETIKDRIRDDEVTPHSLKDGTTLIDTGQLVNSIDFEVNE